MVLVEFLSIISVTHRWNLPFVTLKLLSLDLILYVFYMSRMIVM